MDAAGSDIFSGLTDITPLGYSGVTDLQLTSAHDKANGHVFSPEVPEMCPYGTNNGGGTSPSSLARTLAELNVKIYECAARFPSEKHNSSARSKGFIGHPGPEAQKPIQFVFDELFSVTSAFTNILESLCTPGHGINTSSSVSSSTSLGLPDWMTYRDYSPSYSQEPSHADHHHSAPMPPALAPPSSCSLANVDEATMYMLTSCHCRLTEVYASVFEQIQACVKHSAIPQTDYRWTVVLPRLQVSSLALPPVQLDEKSRIDSRATLTMYIMMVTMLSSQLWEKMADVMRSAGRHVLVDSEGTETPASAPASGISSAAGPAWRSAMEKTRKLTEDIASVQGLMGHTP